MSCWLDVRIVVVCEEKEEEEGAGQAAGWWCVGAVLDLPGPSFSQSVQSW